MSDRESDTSRSLSPGEARSPTPQPSRRMSDDGSPKPRSTSRSADSHKSGSHSRRSPPPRSRSRSPKRYRRSYSRGKRYRSRSRSRSPRYDKRRRSRYSRSRSRSYSPSSRRGRSRSPMSSRRRHQGNRVSMQEASRKQSYGHHVGNRHHLGDRENPRTSRCLGIFGLSLYTQERELRDMFSRYGPVDEVNIVYDHQTGRSRGFAFLYMRNLEDAVEARERAAGSEVDGRKIRVDFSITERAHTPTPGIYLGKPTASGYRGGSGGGGGGGYRGRSPSPYYRGRGRYSRSRSRSRSYSPREKRRVKGIEERKKMKKKKG